MKMDQETFDRRFRELYTGLVEIAFEFVGRNKQEVDAVYVFGTMGIRGYYYNWCYRINGKLVAVEDVNDVSKQQYDLSDDRCDALTEIGIEDLKKTEALFVEAGKEAPTLMKMVYYPKTGQFNNDLDYELILSDRSKSINMFFKEWFAGLSKSSA
jgi:hypothetical protein